MTDKEYLNLRRKLITELDDLRGRIQRLDRRHYGWPKMEWPKLKRIQAEAICYAPLDDCGEFNHDVI